MYKKFRKGQFKIEWISKIYKNITKNNQSMFKNNHELILGEGLTCFQFQQISESFNFKPLPILS